MIRNIALTQNISNAQQRFMNVNSRKRYSSVSFTNRECIATFQDTFHGSQLPQDRRPLTQPERMKREWFEFETKGNRTTLMFKPSEAKWMNPQMRDKLQSVYKGEINPDGYMVISSEAYSDADAAAQACMDDLQNRIIGIQLEEAD